jgi:hypothetical protein
VTILRGYDSDILILDLVERQRVIFKLTRVFRGAMASEGEPLKHSIAMPDARILGSSSGHARLRDDAGGRTSLSTSKSRNLRLRPLMLFFLAVAITATQPTLARSQSLATADDSSADAGTTATRQLDLTYVRPTQRTMVRNYLFDAFGPYPITGAAFAAGINQFTNSPPEWRQGLAGYSRRWGSDFGIVAVGTTTRYALSEAFREDSLYYRCECWGVFPRLRHAVVSTLTARRGEDGHRVFSLPALAAPYAGSFTAVYGWYPDRFGAKDAFRLGNYSLLSYAGGNIALELFYSGPHALLSRMHLNNAHGSPAPGPNQ